MAENLNLWTEPTAIAILSIFFPTIRIWPRGTREAVIFAMRDLRVMLGLRDSFSYLPLLARVKEVAPSRQVVFTGHSMGGSIAAIVAALTHRPSVSFMPPGQYYSFVKHLPNAPENVRGKPQWNWINHQSLALVVDSDWVNAIFDDHAGMTQRISCLREDLNLQLACHVMEGAICELLRHCGDPRPARFSGCDFEYRTPDKQQVETIIRTLRVKSGAELFMQEGALLYLCPVLVFFLLPKLVQVLDAILVL
jgi:hypothetical protein